MLPRKQNDKYGRKQTCYNFNTLPFEYMNNKKQLNAE